MTANKIYSINLASFIYLVAKIEPEVLLNESGQAFFIFPDNQTISLIINIYRRNSISVDLKAYLGCYKHIRDLVRTAKADGKKEG